MSRQARIWGPSAATATANTQSMHASAGFDGNNARVVLQVAGHGSAQQWIRAGSLGQTIQLTSDGQSVSNQLQVELVRQSLPSNLSLDQSVAQAIALNRGLGTGP